MLRQCVITSRVQCCRSALPHLESSAAAVRHHIKSPVLQKCVVTSRVQCCSQWCRACHATPLCGSAPLLQCSALVYAQVQGVQEPCLGAVDELAVLLHARLTQQVFPCMCFPMHSPHLLGYREHGGLAAARTADTTTSIYMRTRSRLTSWRYKEQAGLAAAPTPDTTTSTCMRTRSRRTSRGERTR